VKPAYVAETLVSYAKELGRDHMPCDPALITESHISQIFLELDKGRIGKDSVTPILVGIAKGKGLDFSKHRLADAKDVEDGVRKILRQNKGAPFGALMGLVMKEYRGKADGKAISEMIDKILKE
jgi:glutamyl-tRNA(Gln) amidotransferase subunit E